MQAMQYKIVFPADYDMEKIRKRVKDNGHKTDGFKDLLFKAYLITEKSLGDLENSYCPLYVWKATDGMTHFIFGGYFDNIIASFGWKNIEIGVTSEISLDRSFSESKYVIEECHDIHQQPSLKEVGLKSHDDDNSLGRVTIYNPDKWKYVTFSFFKEQPVLKPNLKRYSILHLSLEE